MKSKNRLIKRFLSRFLLILGGLMLILLICYLSIKNNIHSVIPQKVYRSAQLAPGTLDQLIHDKNIKSIVNLRGYNPDQSWYQGEVKVSKHNKIKHYDLPMRAKKLPSPKLLRELITTLQKAPRPMLIHCESGSDRTGLAAAIVLILNNKNSLSTAEKQISWKYFVTSNKTVGRQLFPHYEHWLTNHKLTSNKSNFLHWAYSRQPF